MSKNKSAQRTDQVSFSIHGEFKTGEDGSISDMSLASIGPAKGHGAEFDMRTLQTIFELSGGKSIPAFNNHSYAPRASETVGMFSGIHIDADSGKARAKNFSWLKSFKEHRADEYATLSELATDHPESFGVSLKGQIGLAWVYEDGSEEDAFDDWLYGNKAPSGAVNESPAVRFTSIASADFVGQPAANDDGLFSAKVSKQSEFNKPATQNDNNMITEISAEYGQNKDLLAEAIQFAAGNKSADFDTVKAHVEQFAQGKAVEAKDARIAELEAEYATQSSKIAELSKKLETLAGGQSEFSTGEDHKEPDAIDDKVLRAEYSAMPAGPARRKFREENPQVDFSAK